MAGRSVRIRARRVWRLRFQTQGASNGSALMLLRLLRLSLVVMPVSAPAHAQGSLPMPSVQGLAILERPNRGDLTCSIAPAPGEAGVAPQWGLVFRVGGGLLETREIRLQIDSAQVVRRIVDLQFFGSAEGVETVSSVVAWFATDTASGVHSVRDPPALAPDAVIVAPPRLLNRSELEKARALAEWLRDFVRDDSTCRRAASA